MNAANFAGCVQIYSRCGDRMSHATRCGSSHLCKRRILQNIRIQVVAIISRLVVRMHLCFGLGRNNKGRCFLRNVAKRLHP